MAIFDNSLLISLFVYLVSADPDIIPVKDTKVVLNNGPKYSNNIPYSLDDADKFIKDNNIDETSKIFIFCPDYEVVQYSDFHPVAEAFHKNGGYKFLQLDWGFQTDSPSKVKKPDVEAIKPLLAKFIIKLLGSMDPKNFNFLAYSSGVDLASKVCKEITKEMNVKLPRLTALDPLANSENLEGDADFVQVIHTAAGNQGSTQTLGNADFWVNGGAMQPGCTVENDQGPLGCSHQRAGQYYSESVVNEKSGPQFYAFSAKLPSDLNEKPEQMGINCSPSASGSYYLLTNPSPPFAMD